MKLATFEREGSVRPGAVVGDWIVDLGHVAPDLLGMIEQGGQALAQAREAVAQARGRTRLADVKLLAPIPRPRRNIMCVGRNYAEHARESATTWGQSHALSEHPVFFTKNAGTVSPPGGTFGFDPAVSTQIDWEAELAVIIGRPGRNITAADSMSHVFGYTCLNDITARDLQRRHQQYFKGKSLDDSCPLGPWIVTADEIANPHDLRVTCQVNGQLKQDGNTSQMLFQLHELIASLSAGMTLEAGDIIATGTPSGVGFARNPPEFLEPGDIVTVEVSGIGALTTTIVAL